MYWDNTIIVEYIYPANVKEVKLYFEENFEPISAVLIYLFIY